MKRGRQLNYYNNAGSSISNNNNNNDNNNIGNDNTNKKQKIIENNGNVNKKDIELQVKDEQQYIQHRYGAFKNYYMFNPTEERTKFIDTEDVLNLIFQQHSGKKSNKLQCCDIGCNSGELTLELYNIFSKVDSNKKIEMYGIDMDQDLISMAKENDVNNICKFKTLNIMKENLDGKHHYDLITCFGLTMWIHINHGDKGLKDFLDKLTSKTNTLIIEPHQWKSYRKASKRLRKCKKSGTFEELNNILYRGENVFKYIDETIKNKGFKNVKFAGETKWKRKIFVYKREQRRKGKDAH